MDRSIQAVGLASLAPCCTRFGYLPSHSYISAHIHTHAIRYCKQGCERANLAHMKSSKERVKGTDYVNSTRLIVQYNHGIKGGGGETLHRRLHSHPRLGSK